MFKQPTRPISETSTQAEFNLAGLTEFNPALVYGFDPEASCTYGDQTSVE